MIVAIVRFSLPQALTVAEAAASFEPGAPAYQTVPGLIRKHYLLGEGGLVGGGVYLWESRAHAEALYDEAWRAKLLARYGAEPRVEYFDSPVTVDPSAVIVG